MRIGLAGLLVLFACGASPAMAQYPDHAVRIIVPSPPGGVTDVLGRVVAQAVSQTWNQNVIVDNRPGADEMIGTAAVAKATADGYMLLVTSNGSVTAAPHMHKQMQYDPQKELTPIVMLGQITPMVNVPASSPIHSVQELIALAKANPGKYNYGSFGNGTYAHVAMEDFKARTGAPILHVPYKGSAPAVTALLQDEISVLIVNMGNTNEHVKAGTIRLIASAGPKRAALRPDLPTVAESGVPGFSTGTWWGLFGPANLPAPIVEKIRTDVLRALETPEAAKVFTAMTLERLDVPPTQLSQFLRDDTENWGRQMKAAGIQPE
jgi:tripartite-type tricarboxylate transporter receptor subunit TctC